MTAALPSIPTSRRLGLLMAAAILCSPAGLGASAIAFATKDVLNPLALDGASSVRLADVDGDGDLDAVATGELAGAVGWLENTSGDGSSWTAHVVEAAFTGAAAVVASDLDGDGDLDLLAAAATADDVKWWENDGSPADDTGGDGNSWTERAIATAFDGARAVAAADLDGDGDLDVVGAGADQDDVVWWENDGSPANNTSDLGGGNFWTLHTIDAAFGGAVAVAVADLDGDGALDVLAAAETGDLVTWWESDGTPGDNSGGDGNSWTEHTIDSAFDGASAVAVADIDGDGDPDVVATAGVGHDLHWWENDGTPTNNTTDDGSGNFWTERVVEGNFGGASGVVPTDLDADGDLDLVATADVDDDLTWWESDGTPADGGWTQHTVDGAFDGARAPAVGDVDGDGDLDLAAAAFDGDEVAWWESETLHSSALLTPRHVLGSTTTVRFAVEDIDVDGDPDFILTNSAFSGSVSWWENDGSPADDVGGSGNSWTSHSVGAGVDLAGAASVVPADLDRDGDRDLLVTAEGTDRVAWWENDGSPLDGGWTERLVSTGLTEPRAAIVADLDGDGDDDVAVAGFFSDRVAWWENDGTPGNNTTDDGGGNFWTVHEVDSAFDGPNWLVVADLDGDGDPDLLGAALTGGEVVWWENDGTPGNNTTDDGSGNFWTEHPIDDAFTSARTALAADVDGDGDLDVVGSSSGLADVVWWENDGTPGNNTTDDGSGNFWTEHLVDSSQNASAVAVGDLDGDGDLDIAGTSPLSPERWWENDGTPGNNTTDDGSGNFWTEHQIADASESGKFMAMADVDMDGDLDLVVAFSSAGSGFSWFENRGGQFALATTDTAPPSIDNSETGDLLKIELFHRGRAGDADLELATLELLLEEADGDSLSSAEANALIDQLRIYLDDGSGTFESGFDTLLTTVDPLSLSAGVQSVTLPDPEAGTVVAAGGSKTYFVAVTLTASARSQTPHTFQITHQTEASSSAERADLDLPLRLEFVADAPSSSVVAASDCLSLDFESFFNGASGQGLAGFGRDPSSSPRCSVGLFFAGTVVTVEAIPERFLRLVSWSGTQDDASTSLFNTVLMPESSTLVEMTFDLYDDLVWSNDELGEDVIEACQTITLGTDVTQPSCCTSVVRAPVSVAFDNGFTVESGGGLTVELATPAACSP